MPIVGVTGGFAVGKSFVSSILVKNSAHLLDCDELAREAVEPETKGFLSVVENFGENILSKDGSINRKTLGKIVFHDPKQRRKLEAILHPRILGMLTFRFEEIFLQDKNALIVVEAALLFESGLFTAMDYKITVTCNEEQQIDRAKKRDGISEDDIMAIINSQWPTARKVALSDFVIDNSGDIESTRQQVMVVFEKLSAKT
ncbi:Dephospho-CoA kinase [hydrothermal vent metagenome]|uniref:Dephospho-CoA kinase n=1 Tax=hydrothermal vent metagenome TaxID=652676 RepID=A0A3B1CFP8_9ZZZZ